MCFYDKGKSIDQNIFSLQKILRLDSSTVIRANAVDLGNGSEKLSARPVFLPELQSKAAAPRSQGFTYEELGSRLFLPDEQVITERFGGEWRCQNVVGTI